MVMFQDLFSDFLNFVVALLTISGQNPGSWGVYTGPGGPWDAFPPSSTPNGGRAYELCPKNHFE